LTLAVVAGVGNFEEAAKYGLSSAACHRYPHQQFWTILLFMPHCPNRQDSTCIGIAKNWPYALSPASQATGSILRCKGHLDAELQIADILQYDE